MQLSLRSRLLDLDVAFQLEIDLPDLKRAVINRVKLARKGANWSAAQHRRRLRRGRRQDNSKVPVAATSTTGRPLIRTGEMIKSIKARRAGREQGEYLVKARGYRNSDGRPNEVVFNSNNKRVGGASLGGLTERQLAGLGRVLTKEIKRQLDSGEFWKVRRRKLRIGRHVRRFFR